MRGDNVRTRVDSQPSEKAMQFRRFLRSSTHTAGGVPRKVSKAKLRKFAAQQAKRRPLTGMEVPDDRPHSSIYGSTGSLSRLNTACDGPRMTPLLGPREAGMPDWSMTRVSQPRPHSRGNLPGRRGVATGDPRQGEASRGGTPFKVSRAGTPMSEHRISTPSMRIEAISGEIPLPPIGAHRDDDSEDEAYADHFDP